MKRRTKNEERRTVSVLQSAFTLVELMVVVAIIAILLMLLIPNIRTMREKAWSSHCQNNLRQYGIAMNQYMADHSGYFIYRGFGSGGEASYIGEHGAWKSSDGSTFDASEWDNRSVKSRSAVGSAASDNWENMIRNYVLGQVTLMSLAAGAPSIRVCPVILRDLHNQNYFDPRSANFKGYRTYFDETLGGDVEAGDFESGSAYDASGNLKPDAFLDSSFTTYAINPVKVYQSKSAIPENVVAFIDWNARDGWGAWLGYTNWAFTGTDSQGAHVDQGQTKGTNAWWLTEVGFHHLGASNEYGANYVAMDGHVGWISSNTISKASFTNSLSSN